MKRTMYGVVLGMGVMLGVAISMWSGRTVEAQAAWQCASWTLEEKPNVTAIGTWLGAAQTVQLTSAGLSAGSRFAVVACKR
jgi:hypothetical protein